MPPPSDSRMPVELSEAISEVESICQAPGSRSRCFEYGSSGYKDSIRHFLASSSEVAQIAVQPGTVKDLRKIMKVIKRLDVPFAVKGGGHGMAPTLSSTTGIHISMAAFSKIRYDQQKQVVEIGSGCLWEQVYSKLAPTGRNVVGGASADGVGVGGWLIGGGYSLKSNRHGLGIDNIIEFEIVTPDSRVRIANADKNSDLFQALRGGGNNFGIVTKFTLRSFAQEESTYGSYFLLKGERAEDFKNAMVDFVENETRKEACVVAAFRHELVRGKADPEYTISIFCVFDGEKPKRKRDIPFQAFARLQENSESWKVDPAGWQLGKTHLSTDDSSVEHRLPQVNVPSSRSSTPQPRANGRNRDSSGDSPPQYDDLFPRRRARRRDVDDIDLGSTGYFHQMSFCELHGVSSEGRGGSRRYRDTSRGHDAPKRRRRRHHHHHNSDDDSDNSDDSDDSRDTDAPSRRRRHNKNNRSYDDDDDSDNDDGSDNSGSGTDDDDYGSDGNSNYDDSDDNGSDDDGSGDSDDDDDEDDMEYFSRMDSKAAMKARYGSRIMVTKKVDKMGELSERGRFGCLMISKYTKPLLDKMQEEAEKAASYLKKHRGLSVIIDAWPVHKSIFDNSLPGAAFPHKRGEPYGPMLAYFRWEHEADDDFWLTKLKGTLNRIRVVARNLGLTPRKPAYYNNLSLETVPAHKIYRDNMEWLKRVKAKYDPTNVMGRCGGHKIPLPERYSSGRYNEEDDSD